MTYQMKKREADPEKLLAERRKEILAEYRFHGLDPIRIGREVISMELALILGLIVDTRAVEAGEQVA